MRREEISIISHVKKKTLLFYLQNKGIALEEAPLVLFYVDKERAVLGNSLPSPWETRLQRRF